MILKMKLNDILCDPPGITPEQKIINDREWRDPKNWKGFLFPAYYSELDSRPFVLARMFKPKSHDDLKWAGVLCSQTVNRAHRRGRIWVILMWIAVLSIILYCIFAIMTKYMSYRHM